MAKLNRPPVIYSPTTLQDLLKIYSLNPDSLIYAGGTGLQFGSTGDNFQIRGSVINIAGVEELKKINRTDRYLELGASVPVSRVIDLGKSIVPEALYAALKQMGPPQIRNMATMGGNICRQANTMDIFPVLHLHDSQVELRKFRENRSPRRFLKGVGSRWIPVSRLLDNEGKITMDKGEILTRIRIPSENWSFQSYRKIDGPGAPLIFTALANMDKHIVTDIRLSFSTVREKLIRNRDIEAEMIGHRVPFSKRDLALLKGKLENYFKGTGESSFTTARASALTIQFLEKISEPVDEGSYFQ
ncbi:FAD binding domain-containing protein [Spirochaeta isovalerica]|uniref:CO/xanthine dehydrogenase FAD-binding subunit n=1 Tax=Spirochaeta isovalerica TaxID=150 RepID=A0A841RE09_9SPIO|nr:FAD binding domain-containing protein [Spirochaeta isovalerica]MBB6480602.1 CO/xanthine dehydrogenase FAD-binding subunit [Spirochaeta isovalerica]